VVRLLIASALRLIVALGVGLAVVIGVITAAGVALAIFGRLEFAGGYGLGTVVLMSVVIVALALAVSRLARLALGHIVDLAPRA
jgi:hypothetical protein